MKHLLKPFSLLLTLLFCVSCLCGCGAKEVKCPFTEANWESTIEDIKALETDLEEGGESSYYGASYLAPSTYRDLDGTVQYMFDEEDNLALVQWSYETDSLDELETLYQTIHNELTDSYGEGGFESQFSSSIGGDVWYLENGNIILMFSAVDDYKAIHLSYVSPDHSLENPNK